MLRHFVHYGIHFLIPILIAFFFFKDRKLRVAIILLCGIVIDVDHFWANPLFDPNRCSIGFHPLHSYWAILGYAILPFFKPTRIMGLALLIHILADFMDCLLM
ncbi:hypothetical protein EZV76_07250 [Flagellimonas alvinocaridis]|uniref:Metal-dependent hydrolase n=1 Tax=Flagellimonas alvinocaridis TaxID=2530200 RepID=A0A4S8RT73_9FLAO|nr:DUF6122 family protein [Allomuricauda alvinocaridis]THV60345.1 hypothetical protein EZV76_07250 [Allomuricauda alvinocaridis]